MRTSHTSHPLPAFPVYSSVFLSSTEMVLGGGGGATRSGIKNKLRLYKVDTNRSIDLLNEYELPKGEDAPMSMAVHAESRSVICGINSAADQATNENCRVFSAQDNTLAFVNTRATLPPDDPDDYQKVTSLSPDGRLLVVAGCHDLTVLSFPSLKSVTTAVHTEKEIYDATFSESNLVVATTASLLVYAIPQTQAIQDEKGKRKISLSERQLELVKTVAIPDSILGGSFRAARYSPSDPNVLYTAINASVPRTKKTKNAAHQAYVCRWNSTTWTVEKLKKVSDRGLTCFDVSPDSRFLGFGSSDLSIGILDATNLNTLVKILKAHEFPPTTMTFNTTSSLLVTASADNSVRIVTVPEAVAGPSWAWIIIAILTLLVLLVAFFAQKYTL